jgi:peptidoglycan/xylan/chitin deacetylase (PgdA/CDA1 family)
VIINFHNITSEPLDEFDRHAAPRLDVHAFTRIIDWLSDRFAIVSLETMLDRLSHGESIDGLATLTFDDGHLGILLNGFPVLQARGLVASVMVVTQTLFSPSMLFHFEELELAIRLADAVSLLLPDMPRISLATNADRLAALRYLKRALKTMPEVHRASLHARILDLLATEAQALRNAAMGEERFAKLSIAQLKCLAQAGWGIGAHSRTHRTLSCLDDQDARQEFFGSRDELHSVLGVLAIPFAYPYGGPQHVDARLHGWMPGSGYTCGLLTRLDAGPPGADRYRLQRVNIEDMLRCNPDIFSKSQEIA